MGKMKGWKKINYASVGGAWENEINSNRRIILDNYISDWIVIKQVHTSSHGTNDFRLNKKGMTKEECRIFIMKYMRSHPRG